MTVKYKVISRKNPSDLTAPPKYYPSVNAGGRLRLRQLAKRIAEISTVSSVDTMAVLEGLLTVLPQEIINGNIVELGDFGSFWLRIKSEGSETAEEVSAQNILNTLPKFTPGKEFKQVLQTVEFRKDNGA
ncbi:MAG: HU family DNA-binding protein [Anaerolineales bacterium]|nr:HU family DNA-binding protein [Anaerolineales bacterium]